METTTRRFQNISALLRELNQASPKDQAVNDLLTMHLGAASQHALRMTFVPETEVKKFDTEVVAFWSQLIERDTTSPLFHLPLRVGRTEGCLRGTAARGGPMDGVVDGHPHTGGGH